MDLDLAWVFDPVPPSGAIHGGVAASHVFPADLDTFVREVLQNSHDQRQEADEGFAEVRFTLQRLSGGAKQGFLSAIDWSTLAEHLAGAASGSSAMARRIRQSLDQQSDAPLTILRIEDAGTVGLTGAEDSVGSNFAALCRNTLDTTDNRSRRGGSFGLGKSVLWRFSTFSTVFFSSRVERNPRSGVRFFARTELPYHETRTGRWSGSGWFGQKQRVGEATRAVSIWDEAAEGLSRQAGMLRPTTLGAGTTLLILGFQEPASDRERPLPEIAQDILDSASRWFWPSISLDPPTLRVTAECLENSTRVFTGEAKAGPEILPFVHAVSPGDLVRKARQPGEMAEATIPITIPGRKPHAGAAPESETEAAVNLSIIRGEPGQGAPELVNRVALVRGAGMVVEYRRPSRAPLDDLPFFGVLRAGLAIGESRADEAVERFLRAAEPPAHNEWVAGERIQAEYRPGGKASLKRLWDSLGNAVLDLCADRPPPSGEGPAALARLFRIGATAGSSNGGSTIRVSHLRANLVDGGWSVEGVVCQRESPDKPWRFIVSVWLDGETGRGARLPVTEFSSTAGETAIDGECGTCRMSVGVAESRFVGRTGRVKGLIADCTRVRIEVLSASSHE